VNTDRIKSIDIFRGLCMAWMILGHLFDWWLKPEDRWIRSIMENILEPIGASGFLFISGISIALSYRKRLIKVKASEDYNYRMVRNSYLIRALFIFILAIIYNSTIAIRLNDPSMIWSWFFLLTIAVSLFLAWPLLKIPKVFRILIGILIIIGNQIIVSLLLPHEGNSSIYGFFFLVLYNGFDQDPILYFFPFFLIGTVIGDMIFDTFYMNNEINNRNTYIRQFWIPTIVSGILLVIIGVLFEFPRFLIRKSFSWIIYSLGIDFCLLSILLFFEEFKIIKIKKSYRLLFYYSYYSLTIYLAHNLLYFLFLHQLNIFNIWFFVAAAFISIGVILRVIYKKWGGLASIKTQIGILSMNLTLKIEERIKLKQSKIMVNK